MKKYMTVKNITLVASFFLAGFLGLTNGAIAGSGHFIEEDLAKGIAKDPKHLIDPGTGHTGKIVPGNSVSRPNPNLFSKEGLAKGIAEDPKHLMDHGVENADKSLNTTIFPSNRGSNMDLFSEERLVKGILKE